MTFSILYDLSTMPPAFLLQGAFRFLLHIKNVRHRVQEFPCRTFYLFGIVCYLTGKHLLPTAFPDQI